MTGQVMHLFDRAVADPDGLALDDSVRMRSWAELADRSTRIGRAIVDDLGVGIEGHTAMLMGNRVEFIELVTAASVSGTWLTPINWHLTAEEVAFILEDSDARVLFVDPQHEAVARDAVARAGSTVTVIAVGAELDALASGASDEPFDADGLAGGNMFYTSGTTGRPKGVKRAVAVTIGAQLRAIPAAGKLLGLDGGGPHLVTGPLYHAAPIGFAVMDLQHGAPLVIMPSWDPATTLELITTHDVRNSHMVPTMFVRMLRLDDDVRAAFDPSGLHTVLHGAAPISPAVKERMIDWWGDCIIEYWGASEGGVVTLVGAQEWLAHPGTVGRAIPTYEVFAADDTGQPLAPGETGALYCRNRVSTAVFGYHKDPAKTAAAFLEPGVYTIGDIGHVDADGYVFLSDRASNMIISGGVNIYPAEIEQTLIEHPAVADAAVFGIPDEDWGEQVKAAVELNPGFEPSDELAAELCKFVRGHLAAYKVPRSVDFEHALPRYATGKLYTRRLKEKYWQGHDRRI